MAIAVSLWRSRFHYGDRGFIMAIAVSLWRSLSPYGDRALMTVDWEELKKSITLNHIIKDFCKRSHFQEKPEWSY